MSPSGLFLSMTQAQRDTLRVAVMDRLTNGERTSLSGGGKSGSRAWPYPPDQMLFELNYADRIINGPPRPQKVVQVLNHQYPVTQITP